MSPFANVFGAPQDHTRDSLDIVHQNLATGMAIMLDVRSDEEWDMGHLSGAVHLPIDLLFRVVTDAAGLKMLDRSKIIYCHCRSGVRALLTSKLLTPLGYDVRTLEQSYEALASSGFDFGHPSVRVNGNRLED